MLKNELSWLKGWGGCDKTEKSRGTSSIHKHKLGLQTIVKEVETIQLMGIAFSSKNKPRANQSFDFMIIPLSVGSKEQHPTDPGT